MSPHILEFCLQLERSKPRQVNIVGYEVLNGLIFNTDTPLSSSDVVVIDPGMLTALIEVMYEPVRPDVCPAIAHVTFNSEPATKLP